MLGCKAETTTPVLVAATVENCVQLEPPFMLYCQISATAEELAAHKRLRLGGERLERLVHGLLKLLLVLVEPDALVIESQLPEKISGSGSKSVKHDIRSFLLLSY